ncbi:hypothetical protein [Asticcacaulis sp. AND118]|uniref:hypothetical protein n=1 Tax=Asticcacaulis sp. AND118 TaxID=2840468 RepID=UPI001CFFD052|nr:hypothetical protein [Asticcacaulis sp. AND118]UDF03893.1 hypothetical protein LH365_02300 [Asticcacaulis sp. AND118]
MIKTLLTSPAGRAVLLSLGLLALAAAPALLLLPDAPDAVSDKATPATVLALR